MHNFCMVLFWAFTFLLTCSNSDSAFDGLSPSAGCSASIRATSVKNREGGGFSAMNLNFRRYTPETTTSEKTTLGVRMGEKSQGSLPTSVSLCQNFKWLSAIFISATA